MSEIFHKPIVKPSKSTELNPHKQRNQIFPKLQESVKNLTTKAKNSVEKKYAYVKQRNTTSKHLSQINCSELTLDLAEALTPPSNDELDCDHINLLGVKSNDLIATSLNKLYNKGRFDPSDIVEIVGSLDNEQQDALKKYYSPSTATPQQSKLKQLRDTTGDVLEKRGLDKKYEQDDFDQMVIVALDPLHTSYQKERKLFINLKQLIQDKNYPQIVDILTRISPMNTGDAGKVSAGLLGMLALSSGVIPLLAGAFFGTRRYRQYSIKHEALDPKNKELLKGINQELNKRLQPDATDDTFSQLQLKRLRELQRIFGATS